MTRLETQIRIKALKDELETRHKYGTVKIAAEDGTPVPIETIQDEMFSLIYKLTRMD